MTLPLERLALEPMANGWRSLSLTALVGYDELRSYAEALAAQVGGAVRETTAGAAVRLCGLECAGELYWVAWDEGTGEVTLEPRSQAASAGLDAIVAMLGLEHIS